MFVVLYRWRVNPELEDQFIESWSAITDYFVQHFDSLGSRLHRGDDGIWYAYAQWNTAEQRENAFLNAEIQASRVKMREAVAETLAETILDVQADFLT